MKALFYVILFYVMYKTNQTPDAMQISKAIQERQPAMQRYATLLMQKDDDSTPQWSFRDQQEAEGWG